MEKIGCPPRTPPSRKPQIFGGFGYPRGKPLLEKIGCPPRASPSRKSLLLSVYFIRLFKFILTIKLLIRINIHINHHIQRTRKGKADIKNKNNEVLGKGERERENRFYKIGFPLAVKIISEGETAFRKNRLSPSGSPFPKIFAFIFLFCPLI